MPDRTEHPGRTVHRIRTSGPVAYVQIRDILDGDAGCEVSLMRVLVAYGSTRGGTAGIAELVAETLELQGIDVDLKPAAFVRDVAGYDIVIVGGAVYVGRWHRDARRLLRRHADTLRHKPVWLFSSGPLDESAAEASIEAVPQLTRLAVRVHARGHATFGGRLSPTATGWVAGRMARERAGDWRDRAQIRRWAFGIAEAVGDAAGPSGSDLAARQ